MSISSLPQQTSIEGMDAYDMETVRAVFATLGIENPSIESLRMSIERGRQMETVEGLYERVDSPEVADAEDGDVDERLDPAINDENAEYYEFVQPRVAQTTFHQNVSDHRAAPPANAKASIETAGSSGNVKSEQATRRSPLDVIGAKHSTGRVSTPTLQQPRRDPLNTGEKAYDHQKHYSGYLHLVRNYGEENISIPLQSERSKQTVSLQTHNNVNPSRVAGLLRTTHTPTSTSVIYTAMSARRPNSSKPQCNGSATGGPRRSNDPVSRGQLMRQQWQKDPFLTQRGRKEERWQVRQSMLGWRVEE